MMTRSKQLFAAGALGGLLLVSAAAWLVIGPMSASSQSPGPQVFTTVSNGSLASHGIILIPEVKGEPRAHADDETTLKIKEALGELSLPQEFAEEPRLVRLKDPIPGIPGTAGAVWAVSLTGEARFSGGPNGFTPHPLSTGVYWVALYNPTTGKVEFAASGEKVLKN